MDNELLKIDEETRNINNDIKNKLSNFILKATELIDLSDDDYQIEGTLKLNKISLKSYVLDSDCCNILSDSNIHNYTINELRNYLNNYEKQFNQDYSKYYFALNLYELVEEIENLVDRKINLEIDAIKKIIPNIVDIRNIQQYEYEKMYINAKNELDNYVRQNNVNSQIYNICIQMINDIFNFYISGYPNIPEKYLFHEEE